MKTSNKIEFSLLMTEVLLRYLAFLILFILTSCSDYIVQNNQVVINDKKIIIPEITTAPKAIETPNDLLVN